jgi:hypothetical protein
MAKWLKALRENLMAPVPYLINFSRYADNSFRNGFFVAFILKAINFWSLCFISLYDVNKNIGIIHFEF